MTVTDQFFEQGTRLLTPHAFDFVLDGELKRAVRFQNFLTLVVLEARREWDGMMVNAADGTTTSSIAFTPLAGVADLAGYLVAYSTASGFNPQTQGANFVAYSSPAITPQLAAGTYYAKIAAFDTWSSNATLLNFSTEDSFVISTGVGSPPPGDGGGGTGGGGGGFGGGGGGMNEN